MAQYIKQAILLVKPIDPEDLDPIFEAVEINSSVNLACQEAPSFRS